MSEQTLQSYIDDRFNRLEEKIDSNHKDISEKVYDIHGRTSAIEVKSSVFGLAGGFFAGLLLWLKSHIG